MWGERRALSFLLNDTIVNIDGEPDSCQCNDFEKAVDYNV